MANKNTLEEAILEKLDTLVRLQAHNAVGRFESQKDGILFLSKTGIAPKDIAEILGTTSNTVSVTLSTERKASQKKSRGKKG